MNSNEERARAAIAEQAGERFVANDEQPLDARAAAELADWLRASPAHVEAMLGVAAVARDLRDACADPAYSIDAVVALARDDEDAPVAALWPRLPAAGSGRSSRRWRNAAVAMAACAVLSVGLLSMWRLRSAAPPPSADEATALRLETRHGEQLSRRLDDGSVLHLNTDSAVTVRYGKSERLVVLAAGQAEFEVAHEPGRGFRVVAGSAEIVDVGTRFDVRLDREVTVVTVVEGRVAVGPARAAGASATVPEAGPAPQMVQLGADQQIRVVDGAVQAAPAAVDARRATAWMHRQIVFEREPLERVAAEFNRYAPKPIEITTPALRKLEISGAFATDDTEAFIAFLRSLQGVQVEVTATRIRVFQDPAAAAKVHLTGSLR